MKHAVIFGSIGLLIGCLISYLVFASVNLSSATGYVFNVVGGFTALVAAVSYFAKQLFEHKMELLAEQGKITFSKTYQLRAEAIAEAHGRLLDYQEAIQMFSMSGLNHQNNEERQNAVVNINKLKDAYFDFMTRRALYLPRATEKKVREYFTRLYQYHLQYVFIKDHPPEERSVELKKWLEAGEKMPDALKALEDDFRTALGFTD
jgi:hypothetical protein